MFENDYINDNRQEAELFPQGVFEDERARAGAKAGRRRSRKRGGAALAAACILAAGAFGYAGGYAANLTRAEEPANKEVLYQSVIRTVASGDGQADAAMTLPQAAEAVGQTVVEITTESVVTGGRMGQFISEGAGSGVIVSSDGYIVTNNHVVSGASKIMVRLSSGEEYAAALVGTDVRTDLAVLKIDAPGVTPAILGDSKSLMVGETTVAVGNPLGELGGTVTSGIISALDREIVMDGETMVLLQTDTAINPGNSGGGLFNMYGELVGIVNAKSSGSDIEGLGFAIPINTARPVIEDIIENGYVRGRVDTGLTLIEVGDARTAMMYRVNQTGLYVAESANGELQPGDRIEAVDGAVIESLADFNAQMNTRAVGDTVQLTVARGRQSLTVPLTLMELRP